MFNDCLLLNIKKLERSLTLFVQSEFENINFHPTYAYILTVISSKEFVKTKDIANELNLDSSTVTRMLSKLQNDGYTIKGSLNSSVDISLSDKGKEAMVEINIVWNNYHEKCKKLLGEKELKELVEKLSYANEKISE